MTDTNKDNTKLYGRKEAAKYLNISGTTFDRLVIDKEIEPHSKTPGGRRRYLLASLAEYKKTLAGETSSDKQSDIDVVKNADTTKSAPLRWIVTNTDPVRSAAWSKVLANIDNGEEATDELSLSEFDIVYSDSCRGLKKKSKIPTSFWLYFVTIVGSFIISVSLCIWLWQIFTAAIVLKIILLFVSFGTIYTISALTMAVITSAFVALLMCARRGKVIDEFIDKFTKNSKADTSA